MPGSRRRKLRKHRLEVGGGLALEQHTTTSRSKNTIALSARGPERRLGERSSTTTTASEGTRDAGSRQVSPSTVTRPSVQSFRARDHATPVRSRTTAATVGRDGFMSAARFDAAPATQLSRTGNRLDSRFSHWAMISTTCVSESSPFSCASMSVQTLWYLCRRGSIRGVTSLR